MLASVVAIAVNALQPDRRDVCRSGCEVPTVSAYEVGPGILMTAMYGEDGQVCRMTTCGHLVHRSDSPSTRLGLFLYSRGMLAASSLRLLVTPISFVLWIPTWPNMLNDAQG
jgi:hypothetical protein